MKTSSDSTRFTSLFFWGLLLVLLMVSIGGVRRFLDYEERRDLMNWRITLGVMADQAAGRVESWIGEGFSSLRDLAGNGSLQLYTENIQGRRQPDPSVEPAELSYLRNLVRASADRLGFADRERTGPLVPANVAFAADSSLALLGKDLEIITGTPGISAPDEDVRSVLSKVLEGGHPALVDLRINRNGRPVVGFAVPVSSLMPGGEGAVPVGVLLGMKDAATHLYPLILPPSGVLKTAEVFLVRREGGYVVPISPLGDGTPPFGRRMGADADGLAAVLATRDPGAFGKALDWAGRECLFTGREIAGTPWILVQTVLVEEALSESRFHKRMLAAGIAMVFLFVLAVIAASWFYGSSLKARALSRELLVKNREIGAQAELLGAITGHVTDLLLLLDRSFTCVLANQSAGAFLGLPPADMAGKGLPGLFGPANAKPILDLAVRALEDKVLSKREITLAVSGRDWMFHVTAVPFAYGTVGMEHVLLGLHDLTGLVEAHLGRERLRRQIVSALMRAIDLHDPHSANHSANTAVVALAVGRVLGMDEKDLETLETASNLCNLGKLSIPREILVKREPLSVAERETIRQEVRYAEKILSDIDFAGPVVETILGKYEAVDGSGPMGLKDEDLIPTARVLAAANAFVAMVSPRAYRNGLDPEAAAREIVGRAGVTYDRHVSAALFHVVENDMDWEVWRAEGMLVSRRSQEKDFQ